MRIDGREIAKKVLGELKAQVSELKKKGITPHVAIILVGNDPASVAYVNQKKKQAEQIGATATIYNLESSIQSPELLELIQKENNNQEVHGIIVQRPLPKHINSEQLNQATDAKKDIDAFRKDSPYPMPLPQAVIEILNSVEQNWKEKNIVVIGKGETGGKPIITTLNELKISPTIIDSKTPNPSIPLKNADIIISTVGKPNVLKTEYLKQGVILIGVGMYKGKDGKLHADYEEQEVKNTASFYTPVPGGVGPVNVVMLLNNLVKAAQSTLV